MGRNILLPLDYAMKKENEKGEHPAIVMCEVKLRKLANLYNEGQGPDTKQWKDEWKKAPTQRKFNSAYANFKKRGREFGIRNPKDIKKITIIDLKDSNAVDQLLKAATRLGYPAKKLTDLKKEVIKKLAK